MISISILAFFNFCLNYIWRPVWLEMYMVGTYQFHFEFCTSRSGFYIVKVLKVMLNSGLFLDLNSQWIWQNFDNDKTFTHCRKKFYFRQIVENTVSRRKTYCKFYTYNKVYQRKLYSFRARLVARLFSEQIIHVFWYLVVAQFVNRFNYFSEGRITCRECGKEGMVIGLEKHWICKGF